MLHGGIEPTGGVGHDVDHEPPPGQLQLEALRLEVPDGLADLTGRALTRSGPVMEDAVHRRLANPGLAGDFSDRMGVGHETPRGLCFVDGLLGAAPTLASVQA
jgi:hypothetical protein